MKPQWRLKDHLWICTAFLLHLLLMDDPDVSHLDLRLEMRLYTQFFPYFSKKNFRYMAESLMMYGVLHDHALKQAFHRYMYSNICWAGLVNKRHGRYQRTGVRELFSAGFLMLCFWVIIQIIQSKWLLCLTHCSQEAYTMVQDQQLIIQNLVFHA